MKRTETTREIKSHSIVDKKCIQTRDHPDHVATDLSHLFGFEIQTPTTDRYLVSDQERGQASALLR